MCVFQAQVPLAHCPLHTLVPGAHATEQRPALQVGSWLVPAAVQTLQLGPQAVASVGAAHRVPHAL
jgi:hypothetical protein